MIPSKQTNLFKIISSFSFCQLIILQIQFSRLQLRMNIQLRPPPIRNQPHFRPDGRQLPMLNRWWFMIRQRQQQKEAFEEKLRANSSNLSLWLEYIQWASKSLVNTAVSSIYERAIEANPQSRLLWRRYLQKEMDKMEIEQVRELFRKIPFRPDDHFWYSYAILQEKMAHVDNARKIYEKWLGSSTNQRIWLAYIKFQERLGEENNARSLLYRYLRAYPHIEIYIKVAKFQMKAISHDTARRVLELAAKEVGEKFLNEQYFLSFAKLQIECQNYLQANKIYLWGMDVLLNKGCDLLYKGYRKLKRLETGYIEKETDSDIEAETQN